MLRLWDYRCTMCGTVYRDWPVTTKHIPESITCQACYSPATWTKMKANGIHFTGSGMKYGCFDPQFGCVVEDYGHRQRLLRQMGMVEVGGPEKAEAIAEDRWNREHTPKKQRSADVLVGDSMDEITAHIDQDRVDRRASGPPRDNLDSWAAMEDTAS